MPRWAFPHNARIAFQGNQRFAEIGPVLELVDGDVIARLPARATPKERARDVDHMRRTSLFVDQRRSASGAKASGRSGGFVLKARDFGLALGHAKAAAPTADIGR